MIQSFFFLKLYLSMIFVHTCLAQHSDDLGDKNVSGLTLGRSGTPQFKEISIWSPVHLISESRGVLWDTSIKRFARNVRLSVCLFPPLRPWPFWKYNKSEITFIHDVNRPCIYLHICFTNTGYHPNNHFSDF